METFVAQDLRPDAFAVEPSLLLGRLEVRIVSYALAAWVPARDAAGLLPVAAVRRSTSGLRAAV